VNRAPDDRRSDERTRLSFAKSDDDVGSPRAMREQLKTRAVPQLPATSSSEEGAEEVPVMQAAPGSPC
jgi:hypothetical protein